jgi:hypothetical protein
VGDDGEIVGTWVDAPTGPPPGVPTQVDIDTLAETVPWLDSLKKYVQGTLLDQVIAMNDYTYDATTVFGGFAGATAIAGKQKAYMQNAINSYRNIAKSLDVAVRVTQDIVKNYKDAEHNNSLSVQKIESIFAEEASGKSGSSGQSGATGTDARISAASDTSTSDTSGEIAQ